MPVSNDFLDTGPANFLYGFALTGTVAITAAAVTGTGTALDTELVVGDVVYEPVHGELRKIATNPTPTSATLDVALTHPVPAGNKLYRLRSVGETAGGIDLEETTETYFKETDQRGKVGEIIQDRNVKVTVPLAEWTPENLKLASAEVLPYLTGSNKKLFRSSKSIGLDLTFLGLPAVIKPLINGTETIDPNRIVVFHNLSPSADTMSLSFRRGEQRPIPATFMALPNANGEIYYVGDRSLIPL
jgi:hypothetical protein